MFSITYSDGRCVEETEDGYIIIAERLTSRQITKVSRGRLGIQRSQLEKKHSAVLIPQDMLKNIIDIINKQNEIGKTISMTSRMKKQKKTPLEPKRR